MATDCLLPTKDACKDIPKADKNILVTIEKCTIFAIHSRLRRESRLSRRLLLNWSSVL